MNQKCPQCDNYYFYIKSDQQVSCKTCNYVLGVVVNV